MVQTVYVEILLLWIDIYWCGLIDKKKKKKKQLKEKEGGGARAQQTLEQVKKIVCEFISSL